METGDAPLAGGFGLQLSKEDRVETCCFLESGEIDGEREGAELNTDGCVNDTKLLKVNTTHRLVVSLPNSAAIVLIGCMFVESLRAPLIARNSL